MTNAPLLQLELPGLRKIKSGKVREMFDLGDRLLMVATDRISAFDVIMPNGIPRKGEVLTQISFFWFARFASSVPNHLLAGPEEPLPRQLEPFAAQVAHIASVVVGQTHDIEASTRQIFHITNRGSKSVANFWVMTRLWCSTTVQ